MKITFLTSLFIVFYTYIGYGILLFILVQIKHLFQRNQATSAVKNVELHPVTLIIAAFNEEKIIHEKIENCIALTYPKDRLKIFWVTDGSTDQTKAILEAYDFESKHVESQLFHSNERKGKLAAVERVMPFVSTDFVIYTDANSILNADAFEQIMRHYSDPNVGAVCGEKRVRSGKNGDSSVEGESIYWKIESQLKSWDAALFTVVGAAGELFSIRTNLYEKVPSDTIIEDFHISVSIALRGYRVAYEPKAIAEETGSLNSEEELKRKIRIAAGGFQAIGRFLPLLNFFKYGWLSFQYISHRVLRWTLGPMLLPVVFISNALICSWSWDFYDILFYGQLGFYLLAFIGWMLRNHKFDLKLTVIAYQFCLMNFAVYKGFIRYFFGKQQVAWEKSKRAE